MTTNTSQSETLQTSEVLSKILDDEKKIHSEKRSDTRQLLCVPVQVYEERFDSTLNGFTRDISTQGVCLIMRQPFRVGAKATISVFGKNTKKTNSAKCCWSSKFGSAYWVSGWQLINGNCPVGRLLKDDRLVEPNQRDSDRMNVALPVNIFIPGNTTHIPGFTRNLSKSGICLMSKAETKAGQKANLEIMQLSGETGRFESHCMWAEQYDDENWVSGWKFNA